MIKYIKKKINKKTDNNPEKQKTGSIYGKSYTDEELKKIQFSSSLNKNMEMVNQIIGKSSDLVVRKITLGRTGSLAANIIYVDNQIDPALLDQHIMKPLITDVYVLGLKAGNEILQELDAGNIITRAQMKKVNNLNDFLSGVIIGEVGLIIDGKTEAYVISSKGREFRDITEPIVEAVVRGPRDSFVEVLSINLGLIRSRIRSPSLVMETTKIGNVTQTSVCIAYIRGICKQELVNEVRKRLEKISIDGVLEGGYIEEFIEDNPYSPFPQVRNTERPDVASAALLEGRVVIIVDNTPIVIIAPGEFFSLLHSAEDYYNRYTLSSAIRILRYIAFAMSLVLPSMYIAITTFHQEMIPTELLVSIISSREGVPFPSFIEALIMEFTFEILREAGLRLPRTFGQAVSIVGALVIGQAAVQASIVSPLMVIVVALTGIASFTAPQHNIALPVRILRFPLMVLSALLGLFGLTLGILFILVHLASMRSFGVPYLSPVVPFKASDIKDVVVRLPWWAVLRRPTQIARLSNRMPLGHIPNPQQDGGKKS